MWLPNWGYAETMARSRARREAAERREEDEFARELYVRFVEEPGRHGGMDASVVLGHLLRHNSLPSRVSQLLQHAGLDIAMLQTDRADDWDDEGDAHDAAFQLFGLPPPSARRAQTETPSTELGGMPGLVPIVDADTESDASSMPDLIPIGGTVERRRTSASSGSSSMPDLVPIEDLSTRRRSFTRSRDASDTDELPGLIPLDSPSERSDGLGRESDGFDSASNDIFHDPFDDFHDDMYNDNDDLTTTSPRLEVGPTPEGA